MTKKYAFSLVLCVLLLSACNGNPKVSEKTGDLMQKQSYLAYSPQLYAQTIDQKRILFFKANWCPTCNTADKDFLDNIGKIPEGVTVYQVDYDKETVLKKKYNITYQHTFVQVDTQGNEIAKWNGGGIDKLLSSLK